MSSDADGRLIKTRMIVHLRERVPCDGCSNWKRLATDSWQSERWDVQLVWCLSYLCSIWLFAPLTLTLTWWP